MFHHYEQIWGYKWWHNIYLYGITWNHGSYISEIVSGKVIRWRLVFIHLLYILLWFSYAQNAHAHLLVWSISTKFARILCLCWSMILRWGSWAPFLPLGRCDVCAAIQGVTLFTDVKMRSHCSKQAVCIVIYTILRCCLWFSLDRD